MQEIKKFIEKLKKENEERNKSMNTGKLSEYNHTVTVHKYNYTIEIIQQLEQILNN